MKKLIVCVIAAVMFFCTGSVIASERRSIIEDTNTTIIGINNALNVRIGQMTHYSEYGVPAGGSTARILRNIVYDISPSGSTTWTYKPSERMACAAGYYGSSTYTNYDCHNY